MDIERENFGKTVGKVTKVTKWIRHYFPLFIKSDCVFSKVKVMNKAILEAYD